MLSFLKYWCLFPLYFFLIFIYLFGFSCGTLDLYLWHVGSSSLTRDQTPGLLHWARRVLATGPPGKSPAPSLDLHHQNLQWWGQACFSSFIQSCPTLCDPMNCSTPGCPVHHQLPELTQTHVHWVGDAIQVSSSVVPFFSCLQSFPAAGSFLVSQFFASGC